MLGASPAMQDVFSLIRRVAPLAKAVLITGETGTGKELAARALHLAGPRHVRPFLTVNCSAVVSALFESEIFGHVRGAFPGAADAKPGLFETAQGGTLFFDEIGELPAAAQARLLRVLEIGEVQRVGSMQTRRVDVAIVASSNRDLRADIPAGRFRSDLFYRLDVVEVMLPALRDRREDIPLLTQAFVGDCAQRMGKPLTGVTPDAERLLLEATWHGNVRELKNVIERACMLAEGGLISAPEIADSLGPPLDTGQTAQRRAPAALHVVERGHIVDVLRQVNGNRMAAAKMLGISRRALYRRLERHRIADVP